jgi:hypothetical protein
MGRYKWGRDKRPKLDGETKGREWRIDGGYKYGVRFGGKDSEQRQRKMQRGEAKWRGKVERRRKRDEERRQIGETED